MPTFVQRSRILAFAPLLLAACDDADPSGPLEGLEPANAVLGRAAFVESCAGCHASGDGIDLAFFAFTDTTIIRRAVAHVDTPTARHIVAHIRSLRVHPATRELRLFQPGGAVAAGDVAFATNLFGTDAWPLTLTSAQLAAIHPRDVPIAVAMPVWSDELANVDWMPDEPLPSGILEFRGAAALAAVAGYRAAPTLENLGRAVSALRTADRSMDNPAAPCLLDDPARVDFLTCFETRRWTSSLVAQHLIRFGPVAVLPTALHDVWWDVGNAARKSNTMDGPAIPNRLLNWASWMYLGWSFDPSRHPSAYTGGGFRQLGFPRHATFIALRSQVARPAGSVQPYDDLRQAVAFAPNAWTYAATRFGLSELLARLGRGDAPRPGDDIARAEQQVRAAIADANRKAPAALRPELATLADQVLAALAAS